MLQWSGIIVLNSNRIYLKEYNTYRYWYNKISINDNLYKVIGWLSLSDMRKYIYFFYTFKIINGLAPDYLCSIFPGATGNRTNYPLRNALDRDIIARRTELFPNSFIPSSVSLWNNLPHELKTLQSVSLFKSKIIQSFNISKVPEYHFVGNRQLSVLHTRIRNNCSDLQLELFNKHVSDNAFCS